MDFEQLRTLVAVVEHSSFTRAGTALGLRQSTVSFHIKTLEDQLQVRLLDRDRQGIRPTVQGETLLRYARQLIVLHRDAVAHLKGDQGGHSGHLRVAASTTPAEYLLPPALAQLREIYPQVSVSCPVSDSTRALRLVLDREAEFAIVGSKTSDSRLHYEGVCNDEIVLVGSAQRSYPVCDQDGQSTLHYTPVVGRTDGSGTRAASEELLAKYTRRADQPIDICVGSTQAAKECVLAGLGVSFLSRLSVVRELASGQLVELPFVSTPIARSFYVVTSRGATLTLPAQTLVDVLRRPRSTAEA